MMRTPLTMPPVVPPTSAELSTLANYNDQSAKAAEAGTLPQWVFDHYWNDKRTAAASLLGAIVGNDESSAHSAAVGGSPIAGGIEGIEYWDPEAIKDDNNADTIWKDNDFRAWLRGEAEYNDARTRSMTDYNYQKMREFRSTSYQDTVNDLRAAGLNPVLAYSNGATSVSNGFSSASSFQSAGANSSLDQSTVKDVMAAYIHLIEGGISSAGDIVAAVLK